MISLYSVLFFAFDNVLTLDICCQFYFALRVWGFLYTFGLSVCLSKLFDLCAFDSLTVNAVLSFIYLSLSCFATIQSKQNVIVLNS